MQPKVFDYNPKEASPSPDYPMKEKHQVKGNQVLVNIVQEFEDKEKLNQKLITDYKDDQDQAKEDPFPSELKHYFFNDKEPPNLLQDYHVFGFDTETLVKYHNKAFTRLLVESYLTDLVEKFNYPEAMKMFNYKKNLGVCLNNSVWDIENGVILRLSEEKYISHAIRGYKPLTMDQIHEIYGKPPIFKQLKWPQTNKVLEAGKKGNHWTMMGVFDRCKLAAVCQAMELDDRGAFKNHTMQQLAFDLSSIQYQEKKADENPIFHEKLKENPEKYIQKQPKMLGTLTVLKNQVKKTFIVSNAHVDFAELLMETSFGDDWEELFDWCMFSARKPLFQRSKGAFYEHDRVMNTTGTVKVTQHHDLNTLASLRSIFFLQGNIDIVNNYFDELVPNLDDVKYIYFGNHFLNDIVATHEYNKRLNETPFNPDIGNWETIAVIEELAQYHKKKNWDPQLIQQNENLWGKDYFLTENSPDSHAKFAVSRNFFVNEMSKLSRYAIPHVEYMRNIMGQMQEIVPIRAFGLEKDLKPGESWSAQKTGLKWDEKTQRTTDTSGDKIYPVALNIYDISGGMAKQFSQAIIGKQIEGVWHTSIVIHGKEYYYGKGICYDLPEKTPFGKPDNSKQLGFTDKTEKEFIELLKKLAYSYSAEDYDLFEHNCNNFTNEVAQELFGTGKGIPEEVIALPKLILASPLADIIKPTIKNFMSGINLRSNPLFDDKENILPIQNPEGPGEPKIGEITGHINQAADLLKRFASNLKPRTDKNQPPEFNDDQQAGVFLQEAALLEKKVNQMDDPKAVIQLKSPSFETPEKPQDFIEVKDEKQWQNMVYKYPAVIIVLWVRYSRLCVQFLQFLENAQRNNHNPNLVFCRLDVDSNKELAGSFKPEKIPMVVFYNQGQEHMRTSEIKPEEFSVTMQNFMRIIPQASVEFKPSAAKLPEPEKSVAPKKEPLNVVKDVLIEIDTIQQLKQLIKEKKSVVVRYDSAMNELTKTPWFDDSSANNANEHIVYCSVDVDVVKQEEPFEFDKMNLPRIEMFIDGEKCDLMEGSMPEMTKKHFDYLISELDVEILNEIREKEESQEDNQKEEQQFEEIQDGKNHPNRVLEITSLVQLNLLIKKFLAVAVRFWQPYQEDKNSVEESQTPEALAQKYKELFAEACVQNNNPNLLCVSVNMEKHPEIKEHFDVKEYAQFRFYFKEEEYSRVDGFNVGKFVYGLAKLEFVASGREFTPDTLLAEGDDGDEVRDFLHNKVAKITKLQKLQEFIKEKKFVVVDFGATWCADTKCFRPKIEALCAKNTNYDVQFLTVDVDECLDVQAHYRISRFPQIKIFAAGRQVQELFSCNIPELKETIRKVIGTSSQDLKYKVARFGNQKNNPSYYSSRDQFDSADHNQKEEVKAAESDVQDGLQPDELESILPLPHRGMVFKTFDQDRDMLHCFKRPLEPETIKDLITQDPSSFNPEQIDHKTIDRLAFRTRRADMQENFKYMNIFRVLVLHENNVEYILKKHWNILDGQLISFFLADMPKSKAADNYHIVVLKTLTNLFNTPVARKMFEDDINKGKALTALVRKSLDNENSMIVKYAGMLFNNFMSSVEKQETKTALQYPLGYVLKKISSCICNEKKQPLFGEGKDDFLLYELLSCEIRILYSNMAMHNFITQGFLEKLINRHIILKRNTKHDRIKNVIDDVLSLLPKVDSNTAIGEPSTDGNIDVDLFVIGNPMLDISVYEKDDKLLKKYNIEKGSQCLAKPEQMEIYKEIFNRKDNKLTTGGAALNTACATRFSLRQKNYAFKGITYFGSIGQDTQGDTINLHLKHLGLIPKLHRVQDTTTSQCACIITEGDRSLCCDLSAAMKFPHSYLMDNFKYLESARFVYASCYFLSSCRQAMLEIAKYCTKTSKPFLLNLGAAFLVKHNFEDMMECIAHADYVFCNQREGATFAKKHGFDEDIEAAAMYMADYRQKSDSKPPRMAIITQEGDPTIVCRRNKKGELVVTRHDVVQVPKDKIIDTNGAGDTLVGGFIAGLIRGVDETQALKEGLHLASLIIQKHGCDLEN